MAINNWHWRKYVPDTDGYTTEAKELWAADYRLNDKAGQRQGRYQVLCFHDEPKRYYVRHIRWRGPNPHGYTKASCLSKAFKYLSDAKDAVEMLEVTNT